MTLYFGQKIMKIKKNQKPIDHDIHLKYLCPECGCIHWLSFLEASTINYKVVCDCSCVFSVKRTEKFKIKYVESKCEHIAEKNKPVIRKVIPNDILNKASAVLINYGFTKNEAIDLIKQSFDKKPEQDISSLVKTSLELMKNEQATNASI
jgi:hypothetical protein